MLYHSMVYADCIGQNGGVLGYIFDMHPIARLLPWICLIVSAFVSLPLRAEKGDVEGSRDYPGWTRVPGFEITDYDEDNPAEFTFSVSRPQAIDADHLEAVPVEGHRYVIRYEWSDSGRAPSILKSQRYYEKLATAAGYTVEKSGAVGNVTETFHLTKGDRQIWVFLNPAVRVNILTVVESRSPTTTLAATAPSPSPAPSVSVGPAPTIPSSVTVGPVAAGPSSVTVGPAAVAPSSVTVGPAPAPVPTPSPGVSVGPATPPPAPAPEAPSPATDPLGTALVQDGRVVLPISFLPGKPDLNADSKPVIDRVIAILKLHPEIAVTIEGHTDLTGDEDYNVTLSRQRAQAVRAMLIDGHIRSRRLTAVGLGGSQPVADEGTAAGREKNRRIELVVRTNSTSAPSTPAKPVPKKQITQEDVSPPLDPSPTSSASFHATAPDGVNYYPKTDASSEASSTSHTRSH